MISTKIKYLVIGACTVAAVAVTSFLGYYFGVVRPQIQRAAILSEEKGDLEKRLVVSEKNKKRAMDELVLLDIAHYRRLEQRVEDPPEKPDKTIAIKDLVLASYVSDDYNKCRERKSSVYKKGEIVTLHHVVVDMIPIVMNGEYKIGCDEVHELFEPDGKLVPGVTKVNSFSTTRTVTGQDVFTIPIECGVNTAALRKHGTYTYRITVTDQFRPSNKYVGEIKFTVK
ncbi:hypothetical protein KY331_05140 [Candidatus Woesearchaeota archaeon]|nr:hypothetical protein [Candidatus Woesearchaeota archaeon]